ncbi:MAG: YdcF family protein [Burkholderiaceae bacterium]
MIADWLNAAGLAGVKPFATALALPPVPWLLLALAGTAMARVRPRRARALVLTACVGLWLSACAGCADWIERRCLREPAALGAAERAALGARAAAGESLAIVVLGAGVDRDAPEFGATTLNPTALARLRYGVWLGRQTGIALAASGGRGRAAIADPMPAEADVMAEVARTEFGLPLRWIENRSRDTRENALNTVPLLRAAGVRTIVVVTNGWHMPRAMREFRAAQSPSATGAPPLGIVAAPMGLAPADDRGALRWMPSGEGAQRMRAVLREALAAMV